jgi:murein DD-endopeptidase MepM/ murein hydrolase activator NlpD
VQFGAAAGTVFLLEIILVSACANFSMPPIVSDYMSMTSATGLRRDKIHNGIDIAVLEGHEVLAAADGVVAFALWEHYGGFGIGIDHGVNEKGNMVRSVYWHLSELRVKQGDEVKRGDVIAKSGFTGRSSGLMLGGSIPHLHYGVFIRSSTESRWVNHVDPNKYWLDGKPQCFKSDQTYPPIKTEFTYPVRC